MSPSAIALNLTILNNNPYLLHMKNIKYPVSYSLSLTDMVTVWWGHQTGTSEEAARMRSETSPIVHKHVQLPSIQFYLAYHDLDD